MKEAEKANELRHTLEDENQRLTDEVNEKIGNLEDVQERVANAEDELAELEPKTRRQRRISRTPTRRSMRCSRRHTSSRMPWGRLTYTTASKSSRTPKGGLTT